MTSTPRSGGVAGRPVSRLTESADLVKMTRCVHSMDGCTASFRTRSRGPTDSSSCHRTRCESPAPPGRRRVGRPLRAGCVRSLHRGCTEPCHRRPRAVADGRELHSPAADHPTHAADRRDQQRGVARGAGSPAWPRVPGRNGVHHHYAGGGAAGKRWRQRRAADLRAVAVALVVDQPRRLAGALRNSHTAAHAEPARVRHAVADAALTAQSGAPVASDRL